MPKADVAKRIIAVLVDGGVCLAMGALFALFLVIPYLGKFVFFIGQMIAFSYMACRDALPIGEFNGASFGKKLVGLKAVDRHGNKISLQQSIKRNLPFFLPGVLATLFGSIPAIGPLLGALIGLLGLLLIIAELLKVVSDKDGLRLGDLFAETRVIEVPKA
jgi:uncharacterized RDD family membrane protein YckC